MAAARALDDAGAQVAWWPDAAMLWKPWPADCSTNRSSLTGDLTGETIAVDGGMGRTLDLYAGPV